jgi:uncharacterized protein YqkB
MKIYQSYMFRSKDPAIDKLRTVIQDCNLSVSLETFKDIEANGGPTAGCMKEWFIGKVKRPQNATLEAAGRALGYERVWQKMKKG